VPVPIDAPPATPTPATAALQVTQPIFNADYLDNPAPGYPSLSRRMNEQGRVTLRVLVSAEGRAADVQIRSSSGSVRLDDAALDAVRRWKFVPAKRGSEPVAAWVLIPISFKLEG
jgi:protein TonB